jgi:hypothetical protein
MRGIVIDTETTGLDPRWPSSGRARWVGTHAPERASHANGGKKARLSQWARAKFDGRLARALQSLANCC